jgi:hypothetical protein
VKWKNILTLIRIDVKSGRLIRGQKLRRYRESRILQYVMYGGSCALGTLIGWLVGSVYSGSTDPLRNLIPQGAKSLFVLAPTLVLTYSLVFTMLIQISRTGVKAATQPPYWLPVTWGEHTLASIMSNLIGIPLATLIGLSSGMAAVSVFIDEVPLAVFSIFAMLASALVASTTTEIFRVIQVRLLGAVYKSSGRAAVWIRFFGSLVFFILFYVLYFTLTSGANINVLLQIISSGQRAVWFVPYIWLGMALFSLTNGAIIGAAVFSLGALAFLSALFLLAVKLNSKFGFYEPPAIRISLGTYAPKAGTLGKLGFTPSETSIMRKDFKAFTRRRELMYFFVLPVIFIIVPLMQMSQTSTQIPTGSFFVFLFVLLAPGAIMATLLGSMIIGEEGGAVWHLYSAPVTAKSLIKCKYWFIVIFSIATTLVSGIFGILLTHPSLRAAVTLVIESMFLIVSLSAVSLRAGIKGADFVEVPKPRMVRPLTTLMNMLLCLVLATVILSPFIPYGGEIIGFLNPLQPSYLYFALGVSGTITAVVTYVFYRIALKAAKEFLANLSV